MGQTLKYERLNLGTTGVSRISEGSTLRTPFADELNGTERSEGLI